MVEKQYVIDRLERINKLISPLKLEYDVGNDKIVVYNWDLLHSENDIWSVLGHEKEQEVMQIKKELTSYIIPQKVYDGYIWVIPFG